MNSQTCNDFFKETFSRKFLEFLRKTSSNKIWFKGGKGKKFSRNEEYCILIGFIQKSKNFKYLNYAVNTLKQIRSILQWNLPTADIPNSGYAMNSRQNVKSQMWQSFFKLPPNSGQLSITDKFFKTRRCLLFTGVLWYFHCTLIKKQVN